MLACNVGWCVDMSAHSLWGWHMLKNLSPLLAGCLRDSQSPIILILGIFLGQIRTFHTLCFWCRQMWVAQRVLQTIHTIPHLLTLTTIPRGFEAEVFCRLYALQSDQSPNPQRQSTEGTWVNCMWLITDDGALLLLCGVEGVAEFCTAIAWCRPAWLSEKCTGGSRAGSTEYNASHCYQTWGM